MSARTDLCGGAISNDRPYRDHPQQWICGLLLKNQQPRWALMEMKELDPRENERRNV
jgi:hypothetical protein